MRELGGTVEYLYWPARRTERFLNDNNIPIPQLTTTIASPARGWLPSLSRTVVDLGNRRPQIAKTIETALGQIAVNRFDGPSPIKYAKGTSPVVFGEFKTWDVKHERQPAVMFTAVDYGRRGRELVAICLFGSMDNFPEYVLAAGPGSDDGPFEEGWVSSSAPAVYNFIRSHGKQFDDLHYTPERMAREALKIADGQGMWKAAGNDNAGLGLDRAWERSFTYGEVANAKWLAEIHLDVDLLETRGGAEDGFRRVLVGAPLWVRTPDLQAIELYAKSDPAELAAKTKPRVKRRSTHVKTQTVALPLNLGEIAKPSESDPGVAVPHSIYETLRGGFVAATAEAVVGFMRDGEHRVILLGSAFGRVFAWMWSRDRDQGMIMLADLLANIRGRQEIYEDSPPVRLDEILHALPLCLPTEFSDFREVVKMARSDVRKYYGADPKPDRVLPCDCRPPESVPPWCSSSPALARTRHPSPGGSSSRRRPPSG